MRIEAAPAVIIFDDGLHVITPMIYHNAASARHEYTKDISLVAQVKICSNNKIYEVNENTKIIWPASWDAVKGVWYYETTEE